MEIINTEKERILYITLKGRLDTTTAPDLDKIIIELDTDKIDGIVMDFEELTYVSSAGLRVLLTAQKKTQAKGGVKILKANDEIMDVFTITGFDDILKIE